MFEHALPAVFHAAASKLHSAVVAGMQWIGGKAGLPAWMLSTLCLIPGKRLKSMLCGMHTSVTAHATSKSPQIPPIFEVLRVKQAG